VSSLNERVVKVEIDTLVLLSVVVCVDMSTCVDVVVCAVANLKNLDFVSTAVDCPSAAVVTSWPSAVVVAVAVTLDRATA
jgi:hypothetical protein